MALLARAPISALYGMTLRFDEEGQALIDLPYNPRLTHAMNAVHGGALATILDNAGWFTVARLYPTWIVTVEFHVRLLEPVVEEDVVARGYLVRPGKTISVAEMDVTTADGTLVASGSGTYMVTPTPFDASSLDVR